MQIRKFLLIFPVVAASSLISAAQNNCGGSPAYGTCAAPAAPVQTWCAGNNNASTCPGGRSWVGFDTTLPASGSWSGQFEGLDAKSIALQPGVQATAKLDFATLGADCLCLKVEDDEAGAGAIRDSHRDRALPRNGS